MTVPDGFAEILIKKVQPHGLLFDSLSKAHQITVENQTLCLYFYDDFQEVWVRQEEAALKEALIEILGQSLEIRVVLEKEALPKENLLPPSDQVDLFRRVFKGEIQGAKK